MSQAIPQGIPFTSLVPLFPNATRERLMLLRVTPSSRCAAIDVDRWRQRLMRKLAELGLIGAVSPLRVGVLALGRELTDSDRGQVIGWLVAQPEVAHVQIERGQSVPGVVASGALQLATEV